MRPPPSPQSSYPILVGVIGTFTAAGASKCVARKFFNIVEPYMIALVHTNPLMSSIVHVISIYIL